MPEPGEGGGNATMGQPGSAELLGRPDCAPSVPSAGRPSPLPSCTHRVPFGAPPGIKWYRSASIFPQKNPVLQRAIRGAAQYKGTGAKRASGGTLPDPLPPAGWAARGEGAPLLPPRHGGFAPGGTGPAPSASHQTHRGRVAVPRTPTPGLADCEPKGWQALRIEQVKGRQRVVQAGRWQY